MKERNKTKKLFFPSIEVIEARNPEQVLREAIRKGNWFEGVALSTVYLEEATFYRLRNYLASKRVRARPFLYRMNLSRMARILEELRIIDHKTHSLIGEVNAYRNKLVHEIRTPDAIKPDEAKDIIEKALKCLEAIVSSYESVKK